MGFSDVGLLPMRGRRVEVTMAKTAVLLAAGRGSRLKTLTSDQPKCLVPVAGRPLLDRTIEALKDAGVRQLLVATGYQREKVERFLNTHCDGMTVRPVFCEDFDQTNNIVSLWRVGPFLEDDFLLVECDLLFDPALLSRLNRGTTAAVSPLRPWMDGTVVSLDEDGSIKKMHVGKAARPPGEFFKTINIYRIGIGPWREAVWPRLDAAVRAGCTNVYYEQVFAEAVDAGELAMAGEVLDPDWWREIDDEADLQAAEEWLSLKQ